MTGIGFLGAGAIIRQGFSVRGLTTAATLWVVAAIGMAAGAGYYARRRSARPCSCSISLGPLRLDRDARRRARAGREEAELAIELVARRRARRRVLDGDRASSAARSVTSSSATTRDASTSSLRAARAGRESARVADEVAELDDVEGVQWRP